MIYSPKRAQIIHPEKHQTQRKQVNCSRAITEISSPGTTSGLDLELGEDLHHLANQHP